MRCPHCGGKVIISQNGEKYCKKCGRVIEEPRLIGKISFLLPEKMPREIKIAFTKLRSIADAMGIEWSKIKKEIWDALALVSKEFKRQHTFSMAAAVLYYVLRNDGFPLSIREFLHVSEPLGVRKKRFMHSYIKLIDILGKPRTLKPIHFLTHYLSLLWNSDIRNKIIELPGGMQRLRTLARAILNDIPPEFKLGRRPSLIAGAAIYHAIKAMSIEVGRKRSVVSEAYLAKILNLPRYSMRDTVISLAKLLHS